MDGGAAATVRLTSAGAHLHRWRRLCRRAYRRPPRSRGRTPAYSSAGTGSPADCGGRTEHVAPRHMGSQSSDTVGMTHCLSDPQTQIFNPQHATASTHELSHGAVGTLIS